MSRMSRKEFLLRLNLTLASGVIPLALSSNASAKESESRSSEEHMADIKVRISHSSAIIENSFLRVEYDLSLGTYRAINKLTNVTGIANAKSSVNGTFSTSNHMRRTAQALTVKDSLGVGKALHVHCIDQDGLESILNIALYSRHPFIAFGAGIINRTSDPIRLTDIRPVANAEVFPHSLTWSEAKTLNGGSGGGRNSVEQGGERDCVNNLLLTFKDGGKRRTMVAGGLTYHDFVKYIRLGNPEDERKMSIQRSLGSHMRLVAYLDCGVSHVVPQASQPTIKVLRGKSYAFPVDSNDKPFGTVTFDPNAVILEISGLHEGKSYRFGWSWWDYDDDGRVESVIVQRPDGSRKAILASHRSLPAWRNKREHPAQLSADIPEDVISDGKVRILVTNDIQVPNAVLSEAWLIEVNAGATDHKTKNEDAHPLDLIASDPVGRLVEPGEKYISRDKFYLDFITENPFEALERYGMAVRTAQAAHPNLYDFPTVCAWYVEVYDHGPKINNTAGLVEEMDRVKERGFLKYSPVALRLVPDTYTPDNEQGWWDGAHWRKYGHYTAPYDTSAKWGGAITSRGGLPLIYVQTCFVSADFLKTHPECLLFKSNKGWEKRYQFDAWSYAYNHPELPNYDYTSKAFREHLLQSWGNLREGGVQGVMFDYPESAWRTEGGFEDKRATCAYAYRSPFRICRDGLGPCAWIHERNIGEGDNVPLTDMTAGVVDSQRVWGDNSVFQPEMAAKCALRWYKYRTLYSYDMDAKSLFAHPNPDRTPLSRTRIRSILTMLYVTAGRVLLANSFRDLTREMLHDLSRLYPVQKGTHSARPLDAFTGVACPHIYMDRFATDRAMLVLFNPDIEKPCNLTVSLAGDQTEGSLGLHPLAEYYLYDFWNDRFAGKLLGREKLVQTLEAGETRVFAMRRVEPHPQVISTNRHITQGEVDLTCKPEWDRTLRQLRGTAAVVGEEPYEMVIAMNGFEVRSVHAAGANAFMEKVEGHPELIRVVLESAENADVSWAVGL